MSAEIIPFTGTLNANGLGRTARDANEATVRSFVRNLREELRPHSNKTKLRRKLRTNDDAILLAQRLGADLERVKRLGRGKLSEILENAGQRLTTRARFALFVGDDPADGKRIRKLQPYIDLSDAIAHAMNKDVDLFLYEKLAGLNLTEPDHRRDEEADSLRILLERMARAVSEKTDLIGFFETAARTPGAMHPRGDIHSYAMMDYSNLFFPHLQNEGSPPTSKTVLRDRRHEGGYDHWTEPQPLPIVPICRILEQTISGQACIAKWATTTSASFEKLAEEVSAIPEADMEPITVELWREFGLCLGERFQEGEIGPMFSAKAYVKVHTSDAVAIPSYPWSLESILGGEITTLVDCNRWTAFWARLDLGEDFSDIWIEPVPPPGGSDCAVEHYYFSLHALDAWNIRRILDRSEFDEPRAESLLDEVPDEQRLKLHRFSGDVGRRFEVALASGALESALCANIEQLKREMHLYLADRREKLAEQDEEIAMRWDAENQTDDQIIEGK